MNFYEDDIIAEVRRNREELLEEYGGIEGLHKHMDEERPLLEAQGWKFVSPEEVAAKKTNKPVPDKAECARLSYEYRLELEEQKLGEEARSRLIEQENFFLALLDSGKSPAEIKKVLTANVAM